MLLHTLHVSTHSRSKAAAMAETATPCRGRVSTHSRSKAAANVGAMTLAPDDGFNSQPLEGGCPTAMPCPFSR